MNERLQTFSLALAQLYRLAEAASLDEFPEELLCLMRRRLAFDGAVIGYADPAAQGALEIALAYVHNRSRTILDEYAEISADDPVTRAFMAGLSRPLAVDSNRTYRSHAGAPVSGFVRRHGLRHMLLAGRAPSAQDHGRWVVLYREQDRSFDRAAAIWLEAMWPHVERALDLNRSKALSAWSQGTRPAVALLDVTGRIEAAAPAFRALLVQEWGESPRYRLPSELAAALGRGSVFEGHQLSARFTPHGEHVVCELRGVGAAASLTPRERVVGAKFSTGLSHKEIARELAVSPHTVRSHLAAIYRKLGVSDKASLARLLSAEWN